MRRGTAEHPRRVRPVSPSRQWSSHCSNWNRWVEGCYRQCRPSPANWHREQAPANITSMQISCSRLYPPRVRALTLEIETFRSNTLRCSRGRVLRKEQIPTKHRSLPGTLENAIPKRNPGHPETHCQGFSCNYVSVVTR